MKKIFSTLAFAILLWVSGSSQLQLAIGSGSADANQTLAIDITVSNFTNMSSMQFSLNWDSTAYTYVSVTNLATLKAFDQDAFASPDGKLIKQGQLGITWFDATGQNLPASTRLFTLNLRAKNAPCKSSSLAIANNPTEILFVNSQLESLTYTSTPGTIKVNGTGCTVGGTNPEVKAGTVVSQPGAKVCVPITVKRFKDVEALQGTFKWNPAVLTFLGAEMMAFGSKMSFNDVNTSAGLLGFIYEDGGNPKTLADDAKFMDLCFTAVGANGTSSDITLTDELVEWSTAQLSGNKVVDKVNGKVTISTTTANPVVLKAAVTTVNQDGEICVDITVRNFKNVTALEFGLRWDAAVVQFLRQDGYMLGNLKDDSFNKIDNNTLRVSWTSTGTNPITLADGSKIFQLCFKGIGNCTTQPTSAITFVPEILVGDANGEKLPFLTEAGSIKINACTSGGTCSVVSVKNVSCAGGSDGGVNVTISGATPDCNCVWKKDGVIIQTNPISNCNLVGAAAGNYTMELTCGTNVTCTLTQAITQPAALQIGGSVTNEACSGRGAITLAVSGGTAAYSYKWAPGNETSKDLTNIVAGNYTVTVTDSKACTATQSFTVSSGSTPLTVNGTVTGAKCFGENNGAIALQVSGGCPNTNGMYTYNWSGPSTATGASPTNLAPGNYAVTVTDASNPSQSITKSFAVGGPAAALASTQEITASTGTDGRIKLTITGGVAPFTTVWTGPTAVTNNSVDATNLAAGAYKVTITDAAGCAIAKDIVVPGSGGEFTLLTLDIVIPVSCNGLKNATAQGTFSGGTGPYKVAYTGVGSGNINVANAGSFMIDKLGAGNYTFVVTDNAGTSRSRTLAITQPSRITTDVLVDCATESNEDGGVSLEAAGGTPGYTYRWSTGSTEADLVNVPIGSYSCIVEDANGCQVSVVARVHNCDDPANGCYAGLSIMTPNNDGYNDVFAINCVTDLPGKLSIFDRYGKTVYAVDAYDNTWNGVDSNGQILPEGSYMWVLEVSFPDSRELFSGTVTLLRD